jgi:hypothetical protein
MVWNLALGPGHVLERLGLSTRPAVGTFDLVGLLSAVFFALLAVRELALKTLVDFRGGKLTIRAPLAPWVRFDARISEIVDVLAVPKEDGTHEVGVHMRTGSDRILPLGFETIPLEASWTRKRPFASPVSYATFLAGRLGQMRENARRLLPPVGEDRRSEERAAGTMSDGEEADELQRAQGGGRSGRA